MASTRTLSHALLILTIQFVFNFGKCNGSFPPDEAVKQPDLRLHFEDTALQVVTVSPIKPNCHLVYQDYLTAVENFTHCEIHNAQPFTLCFKCVEEFQMTKSLYSELNSNPDLEPCKTRYMMSDRVQIIPTVQNNVDKIWRMSHCHRCYMRNGTMRERVSKYMTLYKQLKVCVNDTKEEIRTGNRSDVCTKCKSQYASLNANFNGIFDADVGDVCMDIMDMMNYTRKMWTSTFNCTNGSYNSTPVIIISCFVGCTPIIFYLYLRLTGKVRQEKLFRPKRLSSSMHGLSGSNSTAGSYLSTE